MRKKLENILHSHDFSLEEKESIVSLYESLRQFSLQTIPLWKRIFLCHWFLVYIGIAGISIVVFVSVGGVEYIPYIILVCIVISVASLGISYPRTHIDGVKHVAFDRVRRYFFPSITTVDMSPERIVGFPVDTLEIIKQQELTDVFEESIASRKNLIFEKLSYTYMQTSSRTSTKQHALLFCSYVISLMEYTFPIDSPVVIAPIDTTTHALYTQKNPLIYKLLGCFFFFLLLVTVLFPLVALPFFAASEISSEKLVSYIPFALLYLCIGGLFIFWIARRSSKDIGHDLENKNFEDCYDVFGGNEIDRRVVADPYIMQELVSYVSEKNVPFTLRCMDTGIHCVLPTLYFDGIYSLHQEELLQSTINMFRLWKGVTCVQHIFRGHRKQ